MATFVNHLSAKRVSGSGFIMDFGYTSGNTREDMIKDFMDNVRVEGFTPDQEIMDFLQNGANDGDILNQISDCGNYKITVKFFQLAY